MEAFLQRPNSVLGNTADLQALFTYNAACIEFFWSDWDSRWVQKISAFSTTAPGAARDGKTPETGCFRDFWPVAGFDFIDISSSCRLNLVLLQNRHQQLLAQDLCNLTQAEHERVQEVRRSLRDLRFALVVKLLSCFAEP
jgi:hypothetical protein